MRTCAMCGHGEGDYLEDVQEVVERLHEIGEAHVDICNVCYDGWLENAEADLAERLRKVKSGPAHPWYVADETGNANRCRYCGKADGRVDGRRHVANCPVHLRELEIVREMHT